MAAVFVGNGLIGMAAVFVGNGLIGMAAVFVGNGLIGMTLATAVASAAERSETFTMRENIVVGPPWN